MVTMASSKFAVQLLFGLGLALVVGSLGLRRRRRTIDQSKSASKPESPRVFVWSQGERRPVQTGISIFGALLADPATAVVAGSTGHRLSGVSVAHYGEADAFIVSTPKASAESPGLGTDVKWRSGPLPLGNSASWHRGDLAGLRAKHRFCRAAACVVVVDAEGSVLLTRRRQGESFAEKSRSAPGLTELGATYLSHFSWLAVRQALPKPIRGFSLQI